jgi:hypothetical protein
MVANNMDPDELKEDEAKYAFFYFHDFNKDNHLDGNELRVAFQIYEKDVKKDENPKFQDIIDWIDDVLKQDDRNGE